MESQPTATVTDEYRKAKLERLIENWVGQGYSLVYRGEYDAQLVQPKRFSCLAASLSLLAIGIGFLFYVFWYMAQKDSVVYVSVHETGRVDVSYGAGYVPGAIPIHVPGRTYPYELGVMFAPEPIDPEAEAGAQELDRRLVRYAGIVSAALVVLGMIYLAIVSPG